MIRLPSSIGAPLLIVALGTCCYLAGVVEGAKLPRSCAPTLPDGRRLVATSINAAYEPTRCLYAPPARHLNRKTGELKP